MKLPTSAARQYGITRRALGSFGNAAAEGRGSIDWTAPEEQYATFHYFWTEEKTAPYPLNHVSRARWVLPDGSEWVSTQVSDKEMLGGGVPPCVPGAKRAICGKPPDGTKAPRSTFCECMYGDLQPFVGYCYEAAKRYDPWTHEGMAEMVKLAKNDGQKNFNPWSTPEPERWKPHLQWRNISVNSDWTSSVDLKDTLEYYNFKTSRMRLLGGNDLFVCPQPTAPSTNIIGTIRPVRPGFVRPDAGFVPGATGGSPTVNAEVGGSVTLIPNVGGGSTVVPGVLPTVVCGKGLVYAIGKDGKPTCAKPEDLEPKKEGGILAQLLLGAGAGFAVGGPVGAGVGAIAAVALFGKK